MRIKKLLIFLIILFLIVFGSSISYATSDAPNIASEAAILIDSSSKKILYSKSSDVRMYPASTTKILTAILTLENCNLSDVVSVPYEAISSIPSGYTTAALQAGEQLTIEQLLQILLVHSANDAANVLAYHISGSIDAFSDLMNNKVAELGLVNTHFTNPSGIHNQNHYSSAYDLAILMKYCMQNTTFRKFAGLKYCIIPATNKSEERVFNTTNELLIDNNNNVASNYYYKYAIAGKTGYTTAAKNCLVSVSNKDNLELICVVLGADMYPNNLSAKFIDTKSLFDYGYNNYVIKKLRDKNAIATQVEILNGTEQTHNLDALIAEDIDVLISQDNLDAEFSPEIKIDENLLAPIAKGKIIGKITYNIDGIEYSSDLIASHSVEKSSALTLIVQILLIILILFFLYKLLFDTDSRKKSHRKKRY